MSIETPEMNTSQDEQTVESQVETAIGDSPAAAETDAIAAQRWFEIVEVPEVGFRAFVRLPNDYQHKDIREKAMSAKARRIRQLRHPGTDANDVLEFEVEQIAQADDALKSIVHELLLDKSHYDRVEAMENVNEDEEWATVRQDQERYRTLARMASEERPDDEWREVIEHLAKYATAIDAEMAKVQAPRREALENLGLDLLVEKLREKRIDHDARQHFNDTYQFWQTYAGTLVIPEGFDPDNVTRETLPRERIFKTEEELRECDPLIAARIADAFDLLENALSTLTSGNS